MSNPVYLKNATLKLAFAQETEADIYGKPKEFTMSQSEEENELNIIQTLCNQIIVIINDDKNYIKKLNNTDKNMILIRLKNNNYNSITLCSSKEEDKLKKLLKKNTCIHVPH